jgi:hypothetical protein
MEFKNGLFYFVSAIVFMFLSFAIFLKRRYTLKRYFVLLILYAVTVFFIGNWLFTFDASFSSPLTSYYDIFSIIPFKNIIRASVTVRGQWIFPSIIRRTLFSTGVSVLYGFLLPLFLKRKSYLRTAVTALGMMYAVQALMVIFVYLRAVEKQFDTSMFLFEIAGVSAGYFAYRFISGLDIFKKTGMKK